MKILRWGFIGCGEVTEKKSGPAFSEVEGSSVVAVMSRDERKARSYAEGVELAAQGQAYRIADEARSYKTRLVESVKADSAYFTTVLEGWQKNPDTMLTTLYMDALREMLKRTPNKFVVHKTDESATQEMRLHIGLNPEEKKAPAPAPVAQ